MTARAVHILQTTILLACIAAIVCLGVAGIATAADKNAKKTHRVLWVTDATHIVVNLDGVPVPIKLAGLSLDKMTDPAMRDKMNAQAVELLKKELTKAKRQVRLEISNKFDFKNNTTPPPALVWITPYSSEILLNKSPLYEGCACLDAQDLEDSWVAKHHFDTAEAKAVEKKRGWWGHTPGEAAAPAEAAKASAEEAQAPTVASTAAESSVKKGAFYSEKGSSVYHQASCMWVKKINPARLVSFETEKNAESAGLSPCTTCFPPAEATTAKKGGKIEGYLKLIGLKGDKHFHSHVCPLVKEAAKGDRVYFSTVKEATDAGRTPCHSCLRLDHPSAMMPKPGKGECIGRAEPYFRPCLRPAAEGGALCPRCGGKPRE